MIDLSIVIVSYNVRDLLCQCLTSIAKESTGLAVEVLVVDNASSDGSAARVRDQFPSVRLIENAENRGFAVANNQAFTRSQGRHILMLNPDTIILPQALQTMVQFLDEQPRAGACGGTLYYGDGSLQQSAFGFPSLAQVWFDFFPTHWRLAVSRLNGRYPTSWYNGSRPFQIDHPLGADLMVRRKTAEQVGWLDNGYFIYCEEIDWCIRIKRAGWQVWCVPQAHIVHHEGQSTRQFRDEMFVELWRARLRLFEKHYSPAFRMAARFIVDAGLAKLTGQAQAARKQGRISENDLERRLQTFRSVRELLNGSGARGAVA